VGDRKGEKSDNQEQWISINPWKARYFRSAFNFDTIVAPPVMMGKITFKI
jgi:hypothetical protein